MQDLWLAFRALRATPIVTTVAVLSLALGFGANAALFSLANSLLLRPLPVNEPHRLVMFSDTGTPGMRYWNVRVWQHVQRRTGLFEAICAWAPTRFSHSDSFEGQPITGGWVSGSYFETFGVRATLGRVLTDADDRPGGGTGGPVMVISDAFWQRRFQRDPAVIGRQFTLNGVPVSIVGVTPREFLGTDIGAPFDVLLPMADEPTLTRGDSLLDGGGLWVVMLARLKRDQTRQAATDAMRAMQPEIREAQDAYLRDYLKDPFTVVSAASGTSLLRRRYGPPLIALTGAAALVLLVACANIANVLLARASARRHELSVRVALGASRWRLLRQLLVESVLLGVVACAAGLLAATWASPMLVRQLSTQNLPIVLDLSFDWRLTIFAIAVATIAVLIFGVVPALRASVVAPIDALKEQGRGATGAAGGGVRDALVIAQIALSLVLVVAAGLFVRTFASLATRDPGFARDRVLVARLDSRSAIADPMHRIATYERLRQAVSLVPGVADAALSVVTPVSNLAFEPPIDVSGGRALSLRERQVFGNVISPGWFSTFGVPLIAGRDLTEGDRVGTELVAIVNPAFSHRFLNGANPLDHFITLPDVMVQPSPNVPIRIVGVVADAVYGSLREAPQPTMYLPMAQHQAPFFLRNLGTVNLNIRAASESPTLLAKSVAATIRSVDPQLAVTFRPLADQLSDSLARERVVATLASFFGALALMLAALGLYGVTAYAVIRRRTEIGIRMALGARPESVVRLVMSRVTTLVGVGILVGAGISVWMSKLVAALLYGVEARDPATFIGAAVMLAAVAAVSGGWPAWRASRINPAQVLRDS
jgi:putative ABC transport system permease protein